MTPCACYREYSVLEYICLGAIGWLQFKNVRLLTLCVLMFNYIVNAWPPYHLLEYRMAVLCFLSTAAERPKSTNSHLWLCKFHHFAF